MFFFFLNNRILLEGGREIQQGQKPHLFRVVYPEEGRAARDKSAIRWEGNTEESLYGERGGKGRGSR